MSDEDRPAVRDEGIPTSGDEEMTTSGDENTPVMSDELLWNTVKETAEQLPAAELYPFSFEWDAARVKGKWFMISTVRDQRIVNLKADPQDVLSLSADFPSISPGYHMNKKHWITIAPGEAVTVGLVRELVKQSYALVVETLPKREQPVDPRSYLQ
ncbi:MmcQ/YjbR family DNA-binding protein [Aeriscardovia aeriphila]|uniref:MmcQ-like protein n=1 Tax=Aeriscardovia aeriphila TaxID=218139 RepID=A0A261FB30_9BIFI|nr:MmcQ/YjbR family DNA-binding protein [Aeriscardovia aeriphila]NYI25502.1 putative DNA-binding protein (MmcQ/YjbR family) [Aeriscardovia aeriphila]OZG56349.1 MmcQ-like protein [Aeriscardovia aeriphila]